MHSWKPSLCIAAKGIDVGDYTAFLGAELPRQRLLDDVFGLLSAKKYGEERRGSAPLRFLFCHEGMIHIGEYGYVSERLGSDHPYGSDGTGVGRPIKYYYSFSAPIGTPIPSESNLISKDKWIKDQLDELIKGVNEFATDERGHNLNEMAAPLIFDEVGEYSENLWDKSAQSINNGEDLRRVILPDIEKIKPDIGEMFPGAITKLSQPKKINPDIPPLKLQQGGIPNTIIKSNPHLEFSARSEKRQSKISKPFGSSSLVVAIIAATVTLGAVIGILEWKRRQEMTKTPESTPER